MRRALNAGRVPMCLPVNSLLKALPPPDDVGGSGSPGNCKSRCHPTGLRFSAPTPARKVDPTAGAAHGLPLGDAPAPC